MPIKKLTASEVLDLVEIERGCFHNVQDDLLDRQKDKINLCLDLWRTPDRSWLRGKARKIFEVIYNDNALGKEVFLLCALGIAVTRIGKVNLVETVSGLREWWRKADHPRGLAETAKNCVREHQDVFSKIRGHSERHTSLAIVPESNDQHTETQNASLQSSGNPMWPNASQYVGFSCTERAMTANLPDPFRSYLMNCNMWKKEEQVEGISITNCLAMHLPTTPNEDTFLVIRMGYYDGFSLSARLGLSAV